VTTPWLRRGDDGKPIDNAGEVIREYRLASGQSQAAVASAAELTQQALSFIEQGKRPASIEQRRLFAKLLGIPLENLGLSSRGPRPPVAPDNASPEIAASRARWRAQRHWLNHHRSELAQLAVQLYPKDHQVPRTPLIARPDWIPAEPVDMRTIHLELDEGPQTAAVTGEEAETLPVRPLRSVDVPFNCYASTIKHLNPPALFESRPSYRLLSGSLLDNDLKFGLAAYFDKLDVSEALGHEMAIACLDGMPSSVNALAGKLPFRDLIGDAFDPQRRAIIPAITTLTIRLRRFPAEPTFLLHWRDPSKVATAGGIYDVIPAGEFQPSSVALWDRRNDFDIWHNVVREYSEELLGAPEHDGTRTAPIDYENWDLYQALESAQSAGTVVPFVLGMGLDALTLAATILTVVVIDDDAFTDIFGGTVTFNDEGEIVTIGDGRPADGVPFTSSAVERMLTSEPMASPGAACLALAWKHRRTILGT
jgi:transcriptional regulator with XRE-family HTH domain